MDVYREEIKKKILDIPGKGKLIFAILTCEKLLPHYIAFQEIYEWGNVKVLEEGISSIGQCLINKDLFEVPGIEEMITEIEHVTPDTEEFPALITSFALDACTSIISTLNFIISKDDECIVDVALCARDTVHMYIQEKEDLDPADVNFEKLVSADLFMLKEFKRQDSLLVRLLEINMENVTVSDKLIESLRSDAPVIDLRLLRRDEDLQ